MPVELDFFKFARNSTGKRKYQGIGSEQYQDKRQRGNEESESDSGDGELGQSQEPNLPTTKHRVTSKGSNIPLAIDTFEDLRARYHVPSQLFQNLIKSGYQHPTSIQSHAVPIMMNVCFFPHF